MVKVAVWGAAEWGRFVVSNLRKFYSNAIEIEYVVDSNYEQLNDSWKDGTIIQDPERLNGKNVDYVIICSRRYEEIGKILKEQYHINSILYVEILWPEKDSLFPTIKWERLRFIPFEGCDSSRIINEIAESDGKLNKIGIQNGTDKASLIIEQNDSFRIGHNYLKYYERFVDRIEKPRICEFGCFKGASLRTWKERYSEAFIVGIDIDSIAKNLEEERIEVVIGNATDESLVDELQNRYKIFNVICDDASHAWGDIRITFQMMWDLLASGGVYILEDLCCGAQGSFPQYPPKAWDAQSIFDFLLDRTRILEFGLDWNPEWNRHHFNFLPPQIQKIESEIATVTFINGACIIEKR